MTPKSNVLLTLLVGALAFASCAVNKKIDTVKNQLAIIENQQESEKEELLMLDNKTNQKFETDKIDKNIASRIKLKLHAHQLLLTETREDINKVDSLLKGKKSVFRKKFKTVVVPMMDSLQKTSDLYVKRSRLYNMTSDGLDKSGYNLFDLAAFFGPGKYNIPDDKKDLTVTSFAPVLDSIIKFSKSYSDIPQKGTLVILGFADGTGFAEGQSGLTDTLKLMLNEPNASKEEMNGKLSELRAKELQIFLAEIYNDKKNQLPNADNLKLEYISVGKGEEFPLKTIMNYTADDSRRRIVLCYWNVLPNE